MTHQKYSASTDKRYKLDFGDLREGLLIVAVYSGASFILECARFLGSTINVEKGSGRYLSDFSICNDLQFVSLSNCYFPTYQEYTNYYSMKGV